MSTSNIFIAFVLMPVFAYLLGSVSFATLIARQHRIDLRRHGSGNLGATNVGRVLGKKWGYLCFTGDVVKGLLPTLVAGTWLSTTITNNASFQLSPVSQLAWLLTGAAAILGHMFSIFLRFRGGKGVATSLGVVLGIWPYFTLTGITAFLIWTAIWGATRIVSLASIIAAVAFPLLFFLLCTRIPAWQLNTLWPLQTFSIIMALLVVVRHRSNIRRLLAGSENKPRQ